ncbi:uracil-xanthine permease [Globomyces pollinis-pini]|nr:uracil-xanthine permease [Globomyces pollinis-pini]
MTTELKDGYFPSYTETDNKVIGILERPNWGKAVILGAQHTLAMFGGTILSPRLAGFDPNTSLFFSGVGTILFYFVSGGRVPSFLGNSFAFIGVTHAATGYSFASTGLNPNLAVAQGGIIFSGIAYLLVGIIVVLAGHKWIEYLLPPVVTGSVIMAIGLNLSTVAIDDASRSMDSPWQAAVTAIITASVTVFGRGLFGRLPVLVGLTIGFILSIIVGKITGDITREVPLQSIADAPFFAFPTFYAPSFDLKAISLITPVAIIQVAENLGHVKAVGVIADVDLTPYLGRAFIGDALATILAGFGGGLGLTTYAENIGVMAMTNVYSTLIFVIAACFATLLGFIPKFGAIISAIPPGVIGGLSIILFGLVTATGARIWIQNQVDFSDPVNLITAAVAIVLGSGMKHDKPIRFGEYIQLDGLGSATIVCILVYFFFRRIPQMITGERDEESPLAKKDEAH